MCGNIVGGARFKFEGQLLKHGALEGYALYHFATTLIGRKTVEPGFFAIEHAHTCGAIYFVAAEGKEVAVDVLHVDLEVRG